MKKKHKFTIGIAIGMSLCGIMYSTAAPESQVRTVVANIASDVGITLNGDNWQPKDQNNQPIYPLMVEGSSYLPVRAIAEALDIDIRWDGATRRIIIGEDSANAAPEPNSTSESTDGHSHSDSHAEAPEADLTKLPIGDGKYTTTGPKRGYIYLRRPIQDGGGASKEGEWINTSAGTFDMTKKAVVDGEVNWVSELVITVEGDKRILTGNRLPSHPTGTYPISRTDDAYQYDRNPNTIKERIFELIVPANPVAASKASPLNPSAIGVMLTGSYVFNGLDATGRDAVAHETQDSCYGHPEKSGNYHYHNLTICANDTYTGEHSELVGYAADGFGIYGVYGESGEIITNDDLDELHGHSHVIEWDGKKVEMYHYHATHEYPYTLGAFKGNPSSFTE